MRYTYWPLAVTTALLACGTSSSDGTQASGGADGSVSDALLDTDAPSLPSDAAVNAEAQDTNAPTDSEVIVGPAYYVDQSHPAASDSNPGTSEAAPWRTLTKAFATAQPGDLIVVKGSPDPSAPAAVYDRSGSSGLALLTPGLPGKVITFRSYPGHQVILQGDGTANGIDLDSASYHRIVGFTFRNFNKASEGFAPGKTDVLLEKCEFTQTQETGLRLRSITNLTLREVYVHHCFETGISVRDSSHVRFERVESSFNDDKQGTSGDGDGFQTLGGDDFECIDCVARQNSEDGFDLQTNSRLVNPVAAHNAACGIKLWRRDNDSFAEKRFTLVNALVHGSGEAGIKVSEGAEMHLLQATIHSNGEEGVAFRTPTQGQAAVTSEIRNCLIVASGLAGVDLKAGNLLNASNNLYFGNTGGPLAGLALDAASLTDQDPLLVAPAAEDYHLTGASPAIDRGLDLTSQGVSADFEGDKRPLRGGFDLGFDEVP